jgi:methyl-accepting chemotaxis protein
LSSYAENLKLTLLDKLEKIANGEKITGTIVKGKDDEIGPKIKTMQNTINGLVKEIDIITNESLKGNLSQRIYADGFKGEYRKILTGINKTLDYVVEPIWEVADIMSNIEEGQFDIKVKKYKGDFKELGSTIENMVNYVKKIITEISETLYHIAEGNLNIDSLDEYKGDYKKISGSINKIIDNLNLLVGDILKSSEYVSESAVNVEKSSRNLSDDASNMASSIQEISASIQEMNAQTKSSVENAKEANKLVKETNDNADDGKNLMDSMLISMEEINNSSRNIRKIIKVIDEIAFQTNILAINASIEAEQAGQYGKGFSVVADEVRSLAAKCAEAAKNTTEMIEESINKVSTGIKISNETSKALLSINKNSTLSKQIVEDITRASEENATAFEQMNLAVIQISDVIQKTSAISADGAISSEKLSKESNNLKEVVDQFTLKNNKDSQKNNFNIKMDDEIQFDVSEVEKSYKKEKELSKYY